MENAKTAPAACFVIDFDLLVCGLALGLGFEICFFFYRPLLFTCVFCTRRSFWICFGLPHMIECILFALRDLV